GGVVNRPGTEATTREPPAGSRAGFHWPQLKGTAPLFPHPVSVREPVQCSPEELHYGADRSVAADDEWHTTARTSDDRKHRCLVRDCADPDPGADGPAAVDAVSYQAGGRLTTGDPARTLRAIPRLT